MHQCRVSVHALAVAVALAQAQVAGAQPAREDPEASASASASDSSTGDEKAEKAEKADKTEASDSSAPPVRVQGGTMRRLPQRRAVLAPKTTDTSGGTSGSASGNQPTTMPLAPSHGSIPDDSINDNHSVEATRPELAPPPDSAHANEGIMAGFDGQPLVGYHTGSFFVRDKTDHFRFYPRSRLYIDSYNYFGPGVRHTALKSSVLVRRADIGISGETMGRWQWEAVLEVSPKAFSNEVDSVTNLTYAPSQVSGYIAHPGIVYVNYRASDAVNIQIGQFNIPFTAENRTYIDNIAFMDRALPSRVLGVPGEKDIGGMAWGHLRNRVLYWSWAVMQGDGGNRSNADNRAMTAARVYARPFAATGHSLEFLQIGASFKYAMHDKNYVSYAYPSMSTQSGYRFWTPQYVDSVGSGRNVFVIPSGAQLGVAGEIRIPIKRFDLRSEFVYVKNNTREGVDGFQHEYTERFGAIKGFAYHVTASYWLMGEAFLTGIVGDQAPTRLQLDKPESVLASHGVEVAIKWEHMETKYDSASRSGSTDPRNIDGTIRLYALSAGVNYWGSQHIRVGLNYVINVFPTASAMGSSEQRAKAPGNRSDAVFDYAGAPSRDTASVLHELSARVAVVF